MFAGAHLSVTRFHLILLMLAAHSHHLLLVMLRIHLLLMMLSIHLLLMIHRLPPMNRAFVLDSFVVGRLVSLNVVIVAVEIFSLVFVPVILAPKLLGMFCTAHPCSLAVMFSDVSRLVLSFSRSRTLKVTLIYVSRFVSSSRSRCSPCGTHFLSASALTRAFSLIERLDCFLVRFPLVRRSEEIFVFGCRLLTCKLL